MNLPYNNRRRKSLLTRTNFQKGYGSGPCCPRRLENHKPSPCAVQARRPFQGRIAIPVIAHKTAKAAVIVRALNCSASLAWNDGFPQSAPP